VNYCPGKTCSGGDGNHMHVVWQEGTELRRASVARTPWFDIFWCEESTAYASIRYAELRLGIQNEYWTKTIGSWLHYERRGYGTPTFTINEYPDVPLGVAIDKGARDLPHLPDILSYKHYADDLSKLLALDPDEYEAERQVKQQEAAHDRWAYVPRPLNERIDEARQQCTKAITEAHTAARDVHAYLFTEGRPSADEARQSLVTAVADEDARRKRITSITATLLDLPQLFIAV
jgi:hypothetical protein